MWYNLSMYSTTIYSRMANVALYRGGYVHPRYILIDLHYKLLFIVNIVSQTIFNTSFIIMCYFRWLHCFQHKTSHGLMCVYVCDRYIIVSTYYHTSITFLFLFSLDIAAPFSMYSHILPIHSNPTHWNSIVVPHSTLCPHYALDSVHIMYQ